MVAIWKKIDTTVPPNKKASSEERGKEDAWSNQILILFSDPLLPESSTDSLAIQEEIEAIADVLEDVSHPISLDIIAKVATAENIQNIFHQRVKPLIIHFIGHGMINEGKTALVLENEVGIARHFNEQELKIALDHVQKQPCQLVLINSCHSEKLAEAFIKTGVPHAIAVDAYETILDESSRCFAKNFYKNLFEKNLVQNSFSIARNAVINNSELQERFDQRTYRQNVNFIEAYKFQLLPKNQTHSTELNFESAQIHNVKRSNLFTTNLSFHDPKFVGRKQDIQSIIQVFTKSDNRCVVLHGMGGIGKTTLAKSVGRWLQQRDRFKDGVWWINLQDIDSIRSFVIEIQQELNLETAYLVRELKRKKILLMLDDLDNLVKIDSQRNELIGLINNLIENCLYLKILITTREPLANSLELCHQQEVCSMVNQTQLLFDKYAPLNNRWQQEQNYQENIQRLCLFFDGYPLAIKLAAAYAKSRAISLTQLCNDLEIAPLEILQTSFSKEKKDNSLKVSLEISFKRLSVSAQDLFPFLTYFPGGLSIDLARSIWLQQNTRSTLEELFLYSMVEQYSAFTNDWRISIPEPARSYAKSKMSPGQSLEEIAPSVLNYYYLQFVEEKNINQELLKAEKSNLIKFLEWGYEHEENYQKCLCAKITVALIDRWQLIEAKINLLSRLNSALKAAQRNKDLATEQLVNKAIIEVKAKPVTEDVLVMATKNNELEFFQFEVVTVNHLSFSHILVNN